MDYILNGQAFGGVASTLIKCNGDTNALRPFEGADGRSYMNMVVNGKMQAVPINNANALLRKNDWLEFDAAVLAARKNRLRAVQDLIDAGLTYNVSGGMGKTVLQFERQSDINPATISMDGLRRNNADRPVWDLQGLPLPIIHHDFSFPLRQVLASRQGGSPLDTTTISLATRRVAESVEGLLLGTLTTINYGGYNIYGYTNYPSRMTKTMTLPTANGWTGRTLIQEILQMKTQSMVNGLHYGPWMLYTSPNWDNYLDDDYSSTKGDVTVRERIKQINGIMDVRTLDNLSTSGYQAILVDMSSDVVRMVQSMPFTTVQWEVDGGMELHFKVMCIMIPQLRVDINGAGGIVHGTSA